MRESERESESEREREREKEEEGRILREIHTAYKLSQRRRRIVQTRPTRSSII